MEYDFFKNKAANLKLLEDFGFTQKNKNYIYETKILQGEFVLKVVISPEENISVQIFDETGEEYTLHNVETATGEFVGKVRSARDKALSKIAQNCFYDNVFKSKPAKEVINYSFEKYGSSLEFLWKKLPDAAVLRRKDTNKWYGVFMIIPASKLGIDSSEKIEILNLHTQPENMQNIVDCKKYFPGWHMNKKSWFSVNLSENIQKEEIFEKIDESFNLAVK